MITGRKRVNLLLLDNILSNIEGELNIAQFEPFLTKRFRAMMNFMQSYEKLFETDAILNQNTATIYGDEILVAVNYMQISLNLASVKNTNVVLGSSTYYVKHP